MQRKRTVTLPTFYAELCPFDFFQIKSCRSITLEPSKYLHENKFNYKPPSNNVQRTRTVTPLISFAELCPFDFFNENLVRSITLIPSRIFFMTLGTNIKQH